MFNAVYFFSLIGLSNAFTANLIIYVVLMAGVIVSFYLVDRVGRRPLLLGGCAIMSICVFAVGGIGFQTITGSLGNALVALCAIWVAAYSVSIAPIGESCFPAPLTNQAGSHWSSCRHLSSEPRLQVLPR